MRQLWGEEIKPHTVVVDDKLYYPHRRKMTANCRCNLTKTGLLCPQADVV